MGASTEPGLGENANGKEFAIGQRAFLLETPNGNLMWDLVSLLDDETIDFVRFVKHH